MCFRVFFPFSAQLYPHYIITDKDLLESYLYVHRKVHEILLMATKAVNSASTKTLEISGWRQEALPTKFHLLHGRI